MDSYDRYVAVTHVFPLHGVGMTMASDGFVIDFDRGGLLNQVRSSGRGSENDDLEEWIVPVLYRSFDVRWFLCNDSSVWRTIEEVMRHMVSGENLGLICPRRVEIVGPWRHAFVAKHIVEHVAVSLKTIDSVFPLYLYPSTDEDDLLSGVESGERTANLDPELVESLTEAYGEEPAPEEIFHYIYGVLYSTVYRRKYAEFLKIDFPRVPFTADHGLFQRVGEFGKQLVDLHLMRSAELNRPTARFQGRGDNRVEEPRYSVPEDAVYINDTQYFEGIWEDVWEYQIGGYQVLSKWLKDRKGRELSLDDIKHYSKIVTALKRTMDIQAELDDLYPEIEEGIVEFKAR